MISNELEKNPFNSVIVESPELETPAEAIDINQLMAIPLIFICGIVLIKVLLDYVKKSNNKRLNCMMNTSIFIYILLIFQQFVRLFPFLYGRPIWLSTEDVQLKYKILNLIPFFPIIASIIVVVNIILLATKKSLKGLHTVLLIGNILIIIMIILQSIGGYFFSDLMGRKYQYLLECFGVI